MDAIHDLRTDPSIGKIASHQGDVLLSGTGEANGAPGRYSLRFDQRGRFVRRIESELGRTEAFDGERGWQTDPTGMPSALDLGNREQAQLEIWITSGVWLARPDLVDVETLGNRPEEDEIDLEVAVRGGLGKARLTIRRSTKEPVKLVTSAITGEIEVRFDSFFESRGMRFPGEITRSTAGFVESVTRIGSADWLGESDDRAYSQRPVRPNDHRFSEGSGDVELRFAPTGHLLVRPTLDGRQGEWFIFDSGAGQSGIAKGTPGLSDVGSAIVVSIFGVSKEPVQRAAQISLGPLAIDDPVFFRMDLSPLEQYFGEPVGGVMGFDVLSRAVTEVDLEESSMRLHDPATFQLDTGDWLPLRFQDNHPIVPASFSGGEGLFRLDLGASGGPHGNVVFHQPATIALGMLDGQTPEESRLGELRVALGSIDWFELAGVRFDAPQVVYGLEETGVFADRQTVGNIGVNFLSRFRIVLDYSRERIALIPKSPGKRDRVDG